MKERRNCSALAMELRLSSINPSIYFTPFLPCRTTPDSIKAVHIRCTLMWCVEANNHDENHDEIEFYLGNSDRGTWWHSILEQRTPKNQSDWLYSHGLTNVQCHRYLYPYHDIENTGTYNWKHTWNHTVSQSNFTSLVYLFAIAHACPKIRSWFTQARLVE